MLCPHCGVRFRVERGRCAACGSRMTVAALPAGHALVVRSGTPLRDRAGSPAAVLQTLSRGDSVELLERDGSFVKVRLETGASGYVDAVNVTGRDAEIKKEREAEPEPSAPPELPYGLSYLPDESLVHEADFLYDPFGDRAFAVTTDRVVVGGGATLPRVFEIAEVTGVRVREGSNGMALGERTLVQTAASVLGEIAVSGLRDALRAATAIEAAQAARRARQMAGNGIDADGAVVTPEAITQDLQLLLQLLQSGAIEPEEY